MKNILIIKLSALGDVVRTTPHIQAVVDQHPDDQVFLLTQALQAGLFEHHPRLKVEILDRSQWFGPKSVMGRGKWIKETGFDKVIDFQGNRTSRNLTKKSGARVKIGPDPASVYDLHPPRSYSYTEDFLVNFIDFMDQILVAGGYEKAAPKTRFFVGQESSEKVAAWKKGQGLEDGNYAVMHAGSSADFPSKRWPKEHFLKIGMWAAEEGVTPVWVGADEDHDVNFWLASNTGKDATAVFTPIEVHDLAKSARFALCADSGPMYLSAAADIPVFAFFGPTSGIRAHVQGQKHRVFSRDVECGPCFKKVCPKKFHHQCLAFIQPERVWQAILSDPEVFPAK